MALGKPKDGEGKLGSDTAEGKLLMCSLLIGQRKIKMGENKYTINILNMLQNKKGAFFLL